MQSIFRRFFARFGLSRGDLGKPDHPQDVQVLVPEAVELPLPRKPQDEISVPASINGRDLTSGRL
ncbi:MAG: hypothetical protein V7774_12350 [Pseudorhizobium pelagicum]|uniref:hypothetical protein n=1 Tax=Pseudorhizobium pelagicum TaxID=1509405 RepID=UPI00345FFC28